MVLILLWVCCAFLWCGEWGDLHWDDWAFLSGSDTDRQFISGYNLLEEIWFLGSILNHIISNCNMMFLLLRLWKPQNKFCHNVFYAKILHQNLGQRSCGIPRSASSCRTVSGWSLLIAARTRSSFSGVLLVAGLPEHGSPSPDSWPLLRHLCHTFICAALIASSLKAFWIIWMFPQRNVQA